MFLKEEIILLADFNSLDENGLLPTTLHYAIFLKRPKVGDWVRLDDTEGHSCQGRVERITGELIEVAPNWDTWNTETKALRFSGSYSEHPRTVVRGTGDEQLTTGINTVLHSAQTGA